MYEIWPDLAGKHRVTRPVKLRLLLDRLFEVSAPGHGGALSETAERCQMSVDVETPRMLSEAPALLYSADYTGQTTFPHNTVRYSIFSKQKNSSDYSDDY